MPSLVGCDRRRTLACSESYDCIPYLIKDNGCGDTGLQLFECTGSQAVAHRRKLITKFAAGSF